MPERYHEYSVEQHNYSAKAIAACIAWKMSLFSGMQTKTGSDPAARAFIGLLVHSAAGDGISDL